MEVALMALGVGLIIASFEIHFRYLETAKKYYDKQLNDISIKLEEFISDKKPTGKNQTQLSRFLDGLNNILTNFSNERDRSNFPNHLLYGFLGLGIYTILLGFLYDSIIWLMNNPPTPNSDTSGLIFIIFVFAFFPGIELYRGFIALRKITKIS